MVEYGPRHIKLVIAYDGTNYKGWQRQKNELTIQEVIEDTLSSIVGEKINIHGASRTDSGVHAEGQVATFKLNNSPIPTENFKTILNDRLPVDIAIRKVELAPEKFHPSKDAICKTYIYRIYNSPEKDVEAYNRRWQIPEPLDINNMQKAAEYLIGTFDYSGFASSKDDRDETVRTVIDTSIDYKPEIKEIIFKITADRYLYHMVRNIVGTLVEIGRGRWQPEQVLRILHTRKRTEAGPTAPACGLCLLEIIYPDNPLIS